MKRVLLLPLLLFALTLGNVLVPAQTAQAQAVYEGAEGFEVVWTLDPRDNTDIFPRGPAFGGSKIEAGMDFDGDGNKEILFATDETLAPGGPDPGTLDVFLFENAGDDQYEYVWSYSHTDSSNSLPALGYGDMDMDGRWEIYFGIPTIPSRGVASDLFIFEQNEDGTFPDTPTTEWNYNRENDADFRPAGFHVGDIDDDGMVELITVSRTGGNRELVVASLATDQLDEFATFNIEFEAGEDLLGGGGLYDVDVVDFDGDGMMEIWASTWNLLSMTIWEITGADTYELAVDIDEADPDVDHGSFNAPKMLFEDLDGDGDQELLWPSTEGTLLFLDGTDDVSTLTGDDFVRVAEISSNTRGGDLGDIDGNGLFDLIVGTYGGETIWRIEYDGTGDPADSTSYAWTKILDAGSEDDNEPADRFYPLRITDDLDGDGMKEIVGVNRNASEEGQAIVYVLEFKGVDTAVDQDDLPADFALAQNYPNPFNPTTTIAYELKAGATVSLKVYNLMGQLVRTLVPDQVQGAGRYEVTWDARSDAGLRVSSGIYLYTLEHGAARQTRRMTLLK